ncbi:uncharacterized protein LOC126150214 [Schistocerca cancellata]|uniref:uncharacterized protein LOC126150214 n=1 Tax=Schistocerca cancellata TaxID=274614 RepID=UPI00211883D8|nr:uncharacterized protein LOC126150214 [Schistocerca cancellata]
MAEPQAGPSGRSWADSEGFDVNVISRLFCRDYHNELAAIIEAVSERLEVYLSTVQLFKVQITLGGFDADKDGSELEAAFLEQTVGYVESVYSDIYQMESAQRDLGTMAEAATDHWEALPHSDTTPAHMDRSTEIVGHWLMVWCRPFFGRRRRAAEGDDVKLEEVVEASGGAEGEEVQLVRDEGVSGRGAPDEAVQGNEDEDCEEYHSLIEGSDGNGNSDAEKDAYADRNGNGISNGEESWNGNGDSNGNGISNGEDSGNGVSESLDAAIDKCKPNSGHRRLVSGRSFQSLMNEVYRQYGITRRVLLRHIHRLWFLTRARQQRKGGESLLAELSTTLDSVEVEMVEAQLEMTRRAEVVRQFGEAMWPPYQPQPPPEESAQDHHTAGGFLWRVLESVWHTFANCLPQRRN